MKKLAMIIALNTIALSSINAQASLEQKIDKAMKDPKTEERGAKADVLLHDKTKITADDEKAAVFTSKARKACCRKKNN